MRRLFHYLLFSSPSAGCYSSAVPKASDFLFWVFPWYLPFQQVVIPPERTYPLPAHSVRQGNHSACRLSVVISDKLVFQFGAFVSYVLFHYASSFAITRSFLEISIFVLLSSSFYLLVLFPLYFSGNKRANRMCGFWNKKQTPWKAFLGCFDLTAIWQYSVSFFARNIWYLLVLAIGESRGIFCVAS